MSRHWLFKALRPRLNPFVIPRGSGLLGEAKRDFTKLAALPESSPPVAAPTSEIRRQRQRTVMLGTIGASLSLGLTASLAVFGQPITTVLGFALVAVPFGLSAIVAGRRLRSDRRSASIKLGL